MEEWRSYTTLSSQEKRKEMNRPSDSLRFVSSPRGSELTEKAFEMMRISTLQRNELEKMRNNQQSDNYEKEEDWLNSLESWKSKRNWTLERTKGRDDRIKSSLSSDSTEKGRESGLGSSIFSPHDSTSLSSPSPNYVISSYSPSVKPKEEKKSELDQVIVEKDLHKSDKEKVSEEKGRWKALTIGGKTNWTCIDLEGKKQEESTVCASLQPIPRETQNMTIKEPFESKKMEKESIEKIKKTTRMVVDIGIDDPVPSSSFSSYRSSYRASTLNPITPNIPSQPTTFNNSRSVLYPPLNDSSFTSGMRLYGSLPRRKDDDYRVISIDDKKDPGRLTHSVAEYEQGRAIRRDEEPVLIRNYQVQTPEPLEIRPKIRSGIEREEKRMKEIDSWTLPSKWSRPTPPAPEPTTSLSSTGIGRSAQEWLNVTQVQRQATPGIRKTGGVSSIKKQFESELEEKIVKRMERDSAAKDLHRSVENGMNTLSGRKKCADCGLQLGKGSAMRIESIGLAYHLHCFKCSLCGSSLGKGSEGAQVHIEEGQLKCISCYGRIH